MLRRYQLKLKFTPFLFTLLILFGTVSSALSATFYVPDDHTTIQGAITAAATGDTIIIKDGVYSGADNRNLDPAGKDLRIESENGPEYVTIDCENAGRAFIFDDSETADTLVKGLTIINGTSSNGGAVYVKNASPRFENCVFDSNHSTTQGGVAFLELGGTTQFSQCTFLNNSANSNGGSITVFFGASAIINHCLFFNNACQTAAGGAISHSGINLDISASSFFANQGGNGGALSLSKDTTISESLFAKNSANSGGALFLSGGAIDIKNSIITSNTSKNEGGGIKSGTATLSVMNSIVHNNFAPKGGGFKLDAAANVFVRNSILWNNRNHSGKEQIGTDNAILDIDYTNIEGGSETITQYNTIVDQLLFGDNNIDSDPLFTAVGDFHLLPDSPCINRGVLAGCPIEDKDGIARPQQNIVDIGAYEYNPENLQPLLSISPTLIDINLNGAISAISNKYLTLKNIGGTVLDWQISEECSWLQINPESGTTTNENETIILEADPTGLSVGAHSCLITTTATPSLNKAIDTLVTLNITSELYVYEPDTSPGGEYDYDSIQEAINEAHAGDTIFVTDGTYRENSIDFSGKDIILTSLNGPDKTFIDCSTAFNAPCFKIHSGESSSTILNGFTITNHPTLTENYAGFGAALQIDESSPTISNCNFTSNYASQEGGAVSVVAGSPVFTNCKFQENSAGDPTSGGANINGGAISISDGSNLYLEKCIFTANMSRSGGAISIRIDDISEGKAPSKLFINACKFHGNHGLYGGAIFASNELDLKITNSVFSHNDTLTSGGYGGAVYLDGAAACYTCNATIVYNTAHSGGGSFNITGSATLTIDNSILRENTTGLDGINGTANTGESNIDMSIADLPRFANPAYTPGAWVGSVWTSEDQDEDPYRLLEASTYIDNEESITNPEIFADIRGWTRPVDGDNNGTSLFDAGAYEYTAYYGGVPGDQQSKPFKDVRLNATVAVTDFEYELGWSDRDPFPISDQRVFQAGFYNVKLALVNDYGQRIDLDIDPALTEVSLSQQGYKIPFVFTGEHVGVWQLRLELANDPSQYSLSLNSYRITYKETLDYYIGEEIKLPVGFPLVDELPDGIVKPETDNEELFYWSVQSDSKQNKLFAIKPGFTVVTWYDDAQHTTPYPIIVRIITPPAPTIHIANTLPVDLLPDSSRFEMVEMKYTDNGASIEANAFSATREGWSVILFRDNDPQDNPDTTEVDPPAAEILEVVQTLLWNHDPITHTVASDGLPVSSCNPQVQSNCEQTYYSITETTSLNSWQLPENEVPAYFTDSNGLLMLSGSSDSVCYDVTGSSPNSTITEATFILNASGVLTRTNPDFPPAYFYLTSDGLIKSFPIDTQKYTFSAGSISACSDCSEDDITYFLNRSGELKTWSAISGDSYSVNVEGKIINQTSGESDSICYSLNDAGTDIFKAKYFINEYGTLSLDEESGFPIRYYLNEEWMLVEKTSDSFDYFETDFPTTQDNTIGQEITSPLSSDCGNGFVFFENSYYDGYGENRSHDRESREGPIYAVNSDITGSITDEKTDPLDDLVVVWYEKSLTSDVCWPDFPVHYNAAWPVAGEKIIIASQQGSGPLAPAEFGLQENMTIYNQPDRELPGYNPNEEHAGFFTAQASTLPAVFPLRTDLNTSMTSDSFVLLKYRDPQDNKWLFKVYEVEAGDFTYSGIAGQEINPFYPLDQMTFGPCPESETPTPQWVLEDKDHKFFAKNGGYGGSPTVDVQLRYFYRLQQGYTYDREDSNSDGTREGNGVQDAAPGTCIPWQDAFTTIPSDTTFVISWPIPVPTLHIGETLLDAKTQIGESVGLPNIKDQCIAEVLFDEPVADNSENYAYHSVNLIDPLKEYAAVYSLANPEADLPLDLKPEYSLSTGRWVFTALPYHLQVRLTYEQVTGELRLKGYYTSGTGEPTLLLNNLTERDIATINGVLSETIPRPSSNPFWLAVDSLKLQGETGLQYPADHYPLLHYSEMKGLTAGDARGTGYVTLAFNNHEECTAPTMLSVIKVDCELYRGEIKVIESSNPFEEKVTLRHNGDFGGDSDKRWFEWKYLLANFSGIPDGPTNPEELWQSYMDVDQPLAGPEDKYLPNGIAESFYKGVVDITVQGTGKQLLPDKWFSTKYYYEGVCGNPVSAWTKPQLYEGWLKRVMKKINLFDQKAKDFHATDINTIASMISLAGGRYEGDIALNDDPEYLQGIGMIETYETLLTRGLSLVSGGDSTDQIDLNKALLFAANRVSDLYMLLGNEAYADAADPTIGFSTEDGQYGTEAPSIFAFQNQTSSLLDEELALLRGQSTDYETSPYYNRLIWNFTLGDGEVAYKENYNIVDQDIDLDGDGDLDGPDGEINEKDAMVQYPQGHGDAWGHYLSAIKKYYQLLKKPDFTWFPQTEAILVDQAPVSVDYLDERQFAAAAAARSRTGAEIVSLTYRQAYSENPESQWQGYKDVDATRGWGVDGWARRSAQGAYFDWVTGNAMLPAEYATETLTATEGQTVFTLATIVPQNLAITVNGLQLDPAAYTEGEINTVTFVQPLHLDDEVLFSATPDYSIQRVDRKTVLELQEIASNYTSIQTEMDKCDMGLNPLGLTQNTIPFDIDPAAVANGETHFEQIYNRAVQAMNNAVAVFNHANQSSMLLRRQQDSLTDFSQNVDDREADFNNRLVEIYGYPYADDCGPGKTYSTDYCGSGPDIFHYMYVDPSELMGEASVKTHTFTVNMINHEVDAAGGLTENSQEVSFHISTDSRFGLIKPADWVGARKAPGEIQIGRSDLLQARGRFEKALQDYDNLLTQIETQADLIEAQHSLNNEEINILNRTMNTQRSLNTAIKNSRLRASMYRTIGNTTEKVLSAASEAFPSITGLIAGMANGTIFDMTSAARSSTKMTGARIQDVMNMMADNEAFVEMDQQHAKEMVSAQSNISMTSLRGGFAIEQQLMQLENLVRSEMSMRYELYNLAEGMNQSAGRYLSSMAKADRIIADRLRFRRQTAAKTQDYRYKDMAFRIFRNDALQKYRAQFDMAAMYVYLAAKAYDYETSLLDSSNMAGQRFLEDIIKQRSIGLIEGGQPLTGTGLADPMKRLWQNFQVIKPQLGFNNPQSETNRFSLRSELMRIHADFGSNATWQEALDDMVVDNIWDVPEFRRFCRPFAAENNYEPGIVIPFSTTVSAGLNFFGWPLGGGDSYYSSSNFATKVRSVGVWFSNYNAVGLAQTPRVYLVPAGEDVLRSPAYNSSDIRTWRVVDQKLPLPFPIDSSDLYNNEDWIPTTDTLWDELAQIRRHSDFKAYHDSGTLNTSEMQYDSRLIGRSVWNTKWLLIIPGRSLLYDGNEGLETFISGPEIYGSDGERTGNGISDIKIFFQTYAYPGN